MNEYNWKVKLERQRIMEELKKPIDLPEMEMSQYELIREQNVAEIKKFMKESGLFDVNE